MEVVEVHGKDLSLVVVYQWKTSGLYSKSSSASNKELLMVPNKVAAAAVEAAAEAAISLAVEAEVVALTPVEVVVTKVVANVNVLGVKT